MATPGTGDAINEVGPHTPKAGKLHLFSQILVH